MDNTKRETPLDQKKQEGEGTLREKYSKFSRADLLELEVLKAYRNYYRHFNKTYHVQLQLESVVHKGKPLPNVSPLVDANFTAELNTLILTAGHDADLLRNFVRIDVTQAGDEFTQMNGVLKSLKPGDMMMSDADGIVCTIIYGQDQRTPISPKTRRAFYVAYAPPGVPATAVSEQLDSVRDNVLLFAPEAETEMFNVYNEGVTS
ncbi:MAG: hypothetical protein MK230_04155 [Candidatus Marinimicrobia bacterium]|nr:hypothetical protein [Candidatus Neomarinimicrobiota bacterium]